MKRTIIAILALIIAFGAIVLAAAWYTNGFESVSSLYLTSGGEVIKNSLTLPSEGQIEFEVHSAGFGAYDVEDYVISIQPNEDNDFDYECDNNRSRSALSDVEDYAEYFAIEKSGSSFTIDCDGLSLDGVIAAAAGGSVTLPTLSEDTSYLNFTVTTDSASLTLTLYLSIVVEENGDGGSVNTVVYKMYLDEYCLTGNATWTDKYNEYLDTLDCLTIDSLYLGTISEGGTAVITLTAIDSMFISSVFSISNATLVSFSADDYLGGNTVTIEIGDPTGAVEIMLNVESWDDTVYTIDYEINIPDCLAELYGNEIYVEGDVRMVKGGYYSFTVSLPECLSLYLIEFYDSSTGEYLRNTRYERNLGMYGSYVSCEFSDGLAGVSTFSDRFDFKVNLKVVIYVDLSQDYQDCYAIYLDEAVLDYVTVEEIEVYTLKISEYGSTYWRTMRSYDLFVDSQGRYLLGLLKSEDEYMDFTFKAANGYVCYSASCDNASCRLNTEYEYTYVEDSLTTNRPYSTYHIEWTIIGYSLRIKSPESDSTITLEIYPAIDIELGDNDLSLSAGETYFVTPCGDGVDTEGYFTFELPYTTVKNSDGEEEKVYNDFAANVTITIPDFSGGFGIESGDGARDGDYLVFTLNNDNPAVTIYADGLSGKVLKIESDTDIDFDLILSLYPLYYWLELDETNEIELYAGIRVIGLLNSRPDGYYTFTGISGEVLLNFVNDGDGHYVSTTLFTLSPDTSFTVRMIDPIKTIIRISGTIDQTFSFTVTYSETDPDEEIGELSLGYNTVSASAEGILYTFTSEDGGSFAIMSEYYYLNGHYAYEYDYEVYAIGSYWSAIVSPDYYTFTLEAGESIGFEIWGDGTYKLIISQLEDEADWLNPNNTFKYEVKIIGNSNADIELNLTKVYAYESMGDQYRDVYREDFDMIEPDGMVVYDIIIDYPTLGYCDSQYYYKYFYYRVGPTLSTGTYSIRLSGPAIIYIYTTPTIYCEFDYSGATGAGSTFTVTIDFSVDGDSVDTATAEEYVLYSTTTFVPGTTVTVTITGTAAVSSYWYCNYADVAAYLDDDYDGEIEEFDYVEVYLDEASKTFTFTVPDYDVYLYLNLVKSSSTTPF